MSDQLTPMQVVRDLGMVVIPGLTALGGVLRRSSVQASRESEVRNRLARDSVSSPSAVGGGHGQIGL